MRRLIFAATALTLAGVATPSAAQYYTGTNQHYKNAGDNISVRIGQLQTRLQEGMRNGTITRREASPIRQQIRQLTQLDDQYRPNGLTGQERADLQQRIRTIRQQLRRADDGANGRYADWDRDDGNQWGASNNGRIDANNDGWDDRDYNRNGRWDDDRNYGYQQPIYQPPAPRSGFGGLIDTVLGGGALQVGQRVPANLYGVPYQHQNHYRDGNGIYYRSDGRMIYAVDVRTHTVVRVFPI